MVGVANIINKYGAVRMEDIKGKLTRREFIYFSL